MNGIFMAVRVAETLQENKTRLRGELMYTSVPKKSKVSVLLLT